MKYFLIIFVAILHLGESTFDSLINGINSEVVLNNGDVDMQRSKRDFVFNFKKSGKSKEYILVKNDQGCVSIIDAITHENVVSYDAYDAMARTSTIVVNDIVYNIDVMNGTIQTTSVENLMINNLTEWKHVGYFPEENYYCISSPVLNDSTIFFLTCDGGILYGYDIIQNSVVNIAEIYRTGSSYASLILVNGILFASLFNRFYSFDGAKAHQIFLPNPRDRAGLFKLDNSVCIVGGNYTNVSPSPVDCYDPVGKNWTTHSYINEARRGLGVTTSQSGVHIFAGYSWKNNGLCRTAELFIPKYQKWGYIRDPFEGFEDTTGYVHTEALTFTF